MKIVVIGAGALGAYFGGRFHEAGADVYFLETEKRISQIQEKGLQITSTQGHYEIPSPKLITSPDDIDSVDLVFLSVKGHHFPGTLDNIKTLVEKGAYVLPVLNGIEHISILQEHVGKTHVLGGLCFIMSTLNEKGHVVHSSTFHDLLFGALVPEQEDFCASLEKFLEFANMNGVHKNDILRELWKKYLLIHAFSGITTAVNLPIGPIKEHKETFDIMKHLLQEMKIVANEYSVSITDDDVNGVIDSILSFEDDSTSSMHQDRRKGLSLELNHLHGGALRMAEKVGLDMPYTRAIYGMIKPFEKV